MRTLSVVLIAAFSATAYGAYTYYFTDSMESLQTSYWNSSGSPQFTSFSGGYWGAYSAATPGYPSASMVSKVAVPDGTASYEVRATLHFPSGVSSSSGIMGLLLRSSSTFNTNGLPTSAYFIAISCSGSSGGVEAEKLGSFGVAVLAISTFTCSDGMTVRASINDSGVILVFVNDVFVQYSQDSTITSGAPGIALPSYYGSNPYMVASQVQLGPADRIALGPIPTNGLTYTVYPSHVDFQWVPVPDDPNGSGVILYQMLRNDNFATNTTGYSWSDTTVQVGKEYAYTFIVYDGFFNTVTQTVEITIPTTPAATPTPTDGRRVGVRSTGAYWGASTEKIDVLSGNVNYTIPLLTAQARTGWNVGFNITYNSQNWRQDSGGTVGSF